MSHTMGRRPLAASMGLLLFIGLGSGGFQLVLSSMAVEFGLGYTGMGLLVGVQYASIFLMPLFMGRAGDRLGKKRVILAFMAVYLIGCALCVLGHGLWACVLGVFLFGAGGSVCESMLTAAMCDAYPGQGGRAINMGQGMYSAGAVLGPLLCSALMTGLDTGWRVAFLVPGAGFLIAVPLVLAVSYGGGQAAGTRPVGFAGLFANRAFTMFFVSILLYVGLEAGMGYFTESLFRDRLSAAPAGAVGLSLYWGAMAVTRLACGAVRWPAKRLLTAGLSVAAAALLCLSLSPLPGLSLAACAVAGVGFGPVWSLLMEQAAARFPQNSGEAAGVMSSGCGLGGAVFSVSMGAVAQGVSLAGAFALLCATALLCLLLGRLAVRAPQNGG